MKKKSARKATAERKAKRCELLGDTWPGKHLLAATDSLVLDPYPWSPSRQPEAPMALHGISIHCAGYLVLLGGVLGSTALSRFPFSIYRNGPTAIWILSL